MSLNKYVKMCTREIEKNANFRSMRSRSLFGGLLLVVEVKVDIFPSFDRETVFRT